MQEAKPIVITPPVAMAAHGTYQSVPWPDAPDSKDAGVLAEYAVIVNERFGTNKLRLDQCAADNEKAQ